MYSSTNEHIAAYEQWFGGYRNEKGEWVNGVKGRLIPYDECGNPVMVKMPTTWENLKFFFSYQVNFMYWRYFLWNFAGRQNDIQGNGEPEHGNWISGIPLIDNILYGDQSKLPDELKATRATTCSTACRSCWASSDSSGKPSADNAASSSSGWCSSSSS